MDTTPLTALLDLIFGELFAHMDADGLSLENDILVPHGARPTPSDAEKLWEVIHATGFAARKIGFGREGRLELNQAGIQMMTRFGSYRNFLASGNAGREVTIHFGDQGPGQEAPKQKAEPGKAARSGDDPPSE